MTENDTPIDESAGDRDIRELLLRGALVILAIIGVLALVQLYGSVGAVINEWIAHEYRPIFRTALNLVVLLGAGIGISLVVRELTAGR